MGVDATPSPGPARAEAQRAGPVLIVWGLPLGIGIALAAGFMTTLFYYGVQKAPIHPVDALKLTLLMSPVMAVFGILSGGIGLLIIYLPLRNKSAMPAIALSYGPALFVAMVTAPWANIGSALWSMITLVLGAIVVGFLLPDVPPAGEVQAVEADSSVPA